MIVNYFIFFVKTSKNRHNLYISIILNQPQRDKVLVVSYEQKKHEKSKTNLIDKQEKKHISIHIPSLQ